MLAITLYSTKWCALSLLFQNHSKLPHWSFESFYRDCALSCIFSNVWDSFSFVILQSDILNRSARAREKNQLWDLPFQFGRMNSSLEPLLFDGFYSLSGLIKFPKFIFNFSAELLNLFIASNPWGEKMKISGKKEKRIQKLSQLCWHQNCHKMNKIYDVSDVNFHGKNASGNKIKGSWKRS